MYFLSAFLSANICLIGLYSITSKAETLVGCKGTILDHTSPISTLRSIKEISHNIKKLKIPDKFDARTKWRNCMSIKTIHDQKQCGGCWAFAAAAVMSDRLCIATKGKFNKHLSSQDLLDCCKSCVPKDNSKSSGSCEGGYVAKTFDYWERHGIVTGNEGCKPVDKDTLKGRPFKSCRKKCTNKKYNISYKKDKTYGIDSLKQTQPQKKNLKNIQAEIMINGPLIGVIDVYGYILNASSKTILVYDKNMASGEQPVSHAIKILGWDVKKKVKVWIIANTWGTKWCNKGFCLIRRGKNDFNLEEHDMVTGIPKADTLSRGQSTTSTSCDIVRVSKVMFCVLQLLFWLIYQQIDD